MYFTYVTFLIAGAFLALGSSKPIMVTFGTNNGPIVPRQPTTTGRPLPGVTPAPVVEKPEDVPNPSVYKPLVPHQYRSKIFFYKPNPNLILGTPLDIKYTPGLNKYAFKRKQARAIGVGYTGPQFFEKQDYEYDLEKQGKVAESVSGQQYDEISAKNAQNDEQKFVPQIGIVYSSGLRYYVPRIFDYNGDGDNSVYDKNEVKYYQDRNKQYSY